MSLYPINLIDYQLDTNRIFPLRSRGQIERLLGMKWQDILALSNDIGKNYLPMDVKKYGISKWRHIDNPSLKLKKVQKKISKYVLSTIQFPSTMTGGVSRRSIKDNALPHLNKEVVVCLDLRDCFPSVNNYTVFSIFKNGLGCSNDIASVLTSLTTFQERVPQGAPSSSVVVNLALLPLHNDVEDYCIKNNLSWTFYVDDITLSGVDADKHINPIIRIIQKRGFRVRNKKIKIMRANKPQIVTGVAVNRKLNRSNEEVELLRKYIIDLGQQSFPVTQAEVNSVNSKIKFIKNLCQLRGVSLERLANRMLPKIGVKSKIKKDLDEYRPCKSTKRCRSLGFKPKVS